MSWVRRNGFLTIAIVLATIASLAGGADDRNGTAVGVSSEAVAGAPGTTGDDGTDRADRAADPAGAADLAAPTADGSTPGTSEASPVTSAATSASGRTAAENETLPNGGATARGVTADTIKVVYFWTASQGSNNPFLSGSNVNVDEGQAASDWVDYINAHRATGDVWMGVPWDLHGRHIELTVVDVGQYSDPEANRAAAQRIVEEIQPFTVFSNGGVTASRVCPILAAAQIPQTAVGNFYFDLLGRSDGYCIPLYQTWELNQQAAQNYLVNRMSKTPYRGRSGDQPRKFGLVYSEYPGLSETGPVIARRLREAGLPLAATIAISGDLATAATQAPNVIAQLRSAGVNTVIPLDAVAPLTLTVAADGQAYNPDWFIEPCSGADYPALARLYSQNQWSRASGITCNDPEFSPDLSFDDRARNAEWWAKYQRVRRTNNPPAQAPLIYAHLRTILAGITYAGPNLTARGFLDGIRRAPAVRYSFTEGVTDDPTNMLIDQSSYNFMNDFTVLRWDTSARSPGSSQSGAFVYPENAKRYRAGEL